MVTVPALQFRARFRAVSFPPGTPTSPGTLTFTPDDLAHALFVTGRAPGHRAAYGSASFWELLHRTSLVPAYVRMASGGRLSRSRLALELDRSEKVALSYALGQAMTGVFCERLLSVTHLMHVERYAKRYGVQFGPTRKRPDLFGPSPSGWVVAEAKGRSNRMETDLVGKLRNQKRAIRTVAGVPPWIALGCVASFPPDTGAMRIDAFDPRDDEAETIELDIDVDRYYLAYYEPFVVALAQGPQQLVDERTTTVTFEQVGLTLGLDNAVLAAVRGAQESEVTGLAERVTSALGAARERPRMFPDGSLVETQWSDALQVPDSDEGR